MDKEPKTVDGCLIGHWIVVGAEESGGYVTQKFVGDGEYVLYDGVPKLRSSVSWGQHASIDVIEITSNPNLPSLLAYHVDATRLKRVSNAPQQAHPFLIISPKPSLT
jgi:hypothetical protein